MSEVWERLEEETDTAFRAFVVYRDMGTERSIDKTCVLVHPRPRKATERHCGGCTLWSSKYRWLERVRAWENHIDRRTREAAEQAIVEMNVRHAQELHAMGRALFEPVKQFLNDLQAGRIDFSTMPLGERVKTLRSIAHAMPHLVRAERLVRGLPEQAVEITHADTSREATILHSILADPTTAAAWDELATNAEATVEQASSNGH